MDLANSDGAIVIPAHIDDYNGLKGVGDGILKSFYKKDNVNAVQIIEDPRNNTTNLIRYAKEENLALLTFSDKHPTNSLAVWINLTPSKPLSALILNVLQSCMMSTFFWDKYTSTAAAVWLLQNTTLYLDINSFKGDKVTWKFKLG